MSKSYWFETGQGSSREAEAPCNRIQIGIAKNMREAVPRGRRNRKSRDRRDVQD